MFSYQKNRWAVKLKNDWALQIWVHFSCSYCVLALDKGLTAQNIQLTNLSILSLDPSFHDCSAEFRPWQAAVPINTGLCSWRVEQVAQPAPNRRCRPSGRWPGVQAYFISNYRKGSGIWFGFVCFGLFFPRIWKKTQNQKTTKTKPNISPK